MKRKKQIKTVCEYCGVETQNGTKICFNCVEKLKTYWGEEQAKKIIGYNLSNAVFR